MPTLYLTIAAAHLLVLLFNKRKWRWAYKLGFSVGWPIAWIVVGGLCLLIWAEGNKLEAEAQRHANETTRTDL